GDGRKRVYERAVVCAPRSAWAYCILQDHAVVLAGKFIGKVRIYFSHTLVQRRTLLIAHTLAALLGCLALVGTAFEVPLLARDDGANLCPTRVTFFTRTLHASPALHITRRSSRYVSALPNTRAPVTPTRFLVASRRQW